MTEFEEVRNKVIYNNANATDFEMMDRDEVKAHVNESGRHPTDTGMNMWKCVKAEAVFPVRPECIRGYKYKIGNEQRFAFVTNCPVCILKRHKLVVWRK